MLIDEEVFTKFSEVLCNIKNLEQLREYLMKLPNDDIDLNTKVLSMVPTKK